MKPTKSRVFCPDCSYSKILFSSKAKADNFIAFNAEAIEAETGKRPVRSYYCSACGGWHVTSNPNEHAFNGRSRWERAYEHLQDSRERGRWVQRVYRERAKAHKAALMDIAA